jgi:sporulation protein YqfC
MKRGQHFLENMAERIDLPGETFPGQPLVEIAGDRRVLIENHLGVIQYSRERICAKVTYGEICICGSGLELAQMTKHHLVISGIIHQVSLMRRCK